MVLPTTNSTFIPKIPSLLFLNRNFTLNCSLIESKNTVPVLADNTSTRCNILNYDIVVFAKHLLVLFPK